MESFVWIVIIILFALLFFSPGRQIKPVVGETVVGRNGLGLRIEKVENDYVVVKLFCDSGQKRAKRVPVRKMRPDHDGNFHYVYLGKMFSNLEDDV